MPKHGTESTYNRENCRCEPCSAAASAARKARRAKAKARPTPAHAHGTLQGYSYHQCRCIECLRAWKAYSIPYMEGYREEHGERLRARQRERDAERRKGWRAVEDARRERLT